MKTIASKSVPVLLGFLLGLVIASHLEWTQNGRAENKPQTQFREMDVPYPEVGDLAATSRAYVQVAKKIMPTVVSITSEKVVQINKLPQDFYHKDLFRNPEHKEPNRFHQDGLGSGVIIDKKGYIVTNNHVIHEAEKIFVVIDRKKYKAQIIGTDPQTDLAVIKIDAAQLQAIKFGNSAKLEVGELVLAIGNPFSLQLAHSVTAGIVSGKGRTRVGIGDIDFQNFIQTDAAINPGNSGGALVNLRGELVGINTAIVSNSWGGNVGIGFAIPINLAQNVIRQLVKTGKVVRGWLGVYIKTIDQELSEAMDLSSLDGALISNVMKDSPAMNAGLQTGDFIIEIDGTGIYDSNHLMNLVAQYRPSSKVIVRFNRNGKTKSLPVILGHRPESLKQTSSLKKEVWTFGLVLKKLSESLAKKLQLETSQGLIVLGVESGSQADEEGIEPGDLIFEVNRKVILSVAELKQKIADTKDGDPILLRIRRNDHHFFVALKAGNGYIPPFYKHKK